MNVELDKGVERTAFRALENRLYCDRDARLLCQDKNWGKFV